MPDVSLDLNGLTPHYPSGLLLVMIGYLFLLGLDRVLFPHHHDHDHQRIDTSKHDRMRRTSNGGDALILHDDKDIAMAELDPNPQADAFNMAESEICLVTPNDKTEVWNRKAIISSLLIVAMLGVHSFFEGLVLGVQDDTESTVAIVIAILTHKWVESLSLGM